MAKLGHHDREPEWTDERERAWFFAHGLPPAPAPAPFDRKRFFSAAARPQVGRRPGQRANLAWSVVAVAAAAVGLLVGPRLFAGAGTTTRPGPAEGVGGKYLVPHWGAATLLSLTSQAAQQAGSLAALHYSYVATTERQALTWEPKLAVNQDGGSHPVYVAAIPGHFRYRTLPPNAAGRQGRWLVVVVGRVNGSVIATVLLSHLPAPLARLGTVTHVYLPAVRYPPLTDGPVVCPVASHLSPLPPGAGAAALATLNQYRTSISDTPPLASHSLAYDGPAAQNPYGGIVARTCGAPVLADSWAITWGNDPSLATTAFLADQQGHWRAWAFYP
ncbi:MAG: hypothetical protein M0Z54_04085 [Thermaerobacter sp.]|nr:hypothetical protein [Thermaerobacter sp.]